MNPTSSCPKLVVTADGNGGGVVGHAGARLLADLAEATGLERVLSSALAPMRQRDGRHDPRRGAVNMAVMLADSGEAISDLTLLRDQPELFGPVTSPATAWRVLDGIDTDALRRLRAARARAREVAWAQHPDTRGDEDRIPASSRATEESQLSWARAYKRRVRFRCSLRLSPTVQASFLRG